MNFHMSIEMITSHLFVANLAQNLFVFSHPEWCDQYCSSHETEQLTTVNKM